MSSTQELNPKVLKKLQTAVDEALRPVGQAFGVSLELGRITYSSSEATGKLQITVNGTDPRADDFKRFAQDYGLEPTDLGREFVVFGERCTIVGLSTRAKRRPILVSRASNGETYTLEDELVRTALGRPALHGLATHHA